MMCFGFLWQCIFEVKRVKLKEVQAVSFQLLVVFLHMHVLPFTCTRINLDIGLRVILFYFFYGKLLKYNVDLKLDRISLLHWNLKQKIAWENWNT